MKWLAALLEPQNGAKLLKEELRNSSWLGLGEADAGRILWTSDVPPIYMGIRIDVCSHR
jgi:hypothetical protein